jgi:hypothetical protein
MAKLGYGMSQPCGHLDFYPNDGFQQPGCEVTEVPLNLIQAKDLNPLELAQREVFACNHNRAIYYFIESIRNKCQYIGHFCSNYRSYLKVFNLIELIRDLAILIKFFEVMSCGSVFYRVNVTLVGKTDPFVP